MDLYNKYRPKKTSQMIGQDSVVRTIDKWIKTKTVPKAVLFTGPPGCGKTTSARILKRAMGCKKFFSYEEVNAASSRGIDTIRSIEMRARSSSITGPYRVWIIDECHKLTDDAQSAFLQVLESGPKHAYFFLCSNLPHKIQAAIRSRCTELKVRLLTPEEISELVARIANKEKVKLHEDVIEKIADLAGGGARKALVLLHQVIKLDSTEHQMEALDKADTATQSVDLCRLLLNPRAQWKEIAKIITALEDDAETARHRILAYMSAVVLKQGNSGIGPRCQQVLQAFQDPFYDGKPALVRASFEVVFGN